MAGEKLTYIGFIANRDHKTVIYHIRQAERFMDADQDYRAKIEDLAERFSHG